MKPGTVDISITRMGHVELRHYTCAGNPDAALRAAQRDVRTLPNKEEAMPSITNNDEGAWLSFFWR